METKEFDCIAMKREGSARVYEAIKDMTLEEELAYWKVKGDELRARFARVLEEKNASQKPQ